METTTKLDPTFKKKWIAALRSGEYEQGAGFLHNTVQDRYCCLGVACEVVQYKSPNNRRIQGSESMPEELEPVRGYAQNNKVVDRLICMNDTGKTFLKIADYIEENL